MTNPPAPIDWKKLKVAEGSGASVPIRLSQLESEEPRTRRAGAQALHSLLYSDSEERRWYSAAAAAAPVLVDLVLKPETQDRHRIPDLLANVLVGDHKTRALIGFDVSEPETKKLVARGNAAKIYRVVAPSAPRFLPFLQDEDPRVRSAAALLFAFLSEIAPESAPLVREALLREANDWTKTSQLLCLSLLSWYLKTTKDRALLEAQVDGVTGPVSRGIALVAALLLDPVPTPLEVQPLRPDAQAILVDLIRAGDAPDGACPWNRGQVDRIPVWVIAPRGRYAEAFLARCFSIAAHHGGPLASRWAEEALRLVFPISQTAIQPGDLTEDQRAVLTDLCDTDTGANYHWFGLPIHAHELRELLKQ